MYEVNVKKYIEPLINKAGDKKDRGIIERLKITLKDRLYFRCFGKLFPNHKEYVFMSLISSFKYKKYKPNEIILNYNDKMASMYYVVQGKLNVYRMSSTKIKMLISNLLNQNKTIDKWREILDYFNDFAKRYIRHINDKNIYSNNKKEIKNPLQNVFGKNKENQIEELEHFFKTIISHNKALCYCLEEGKVFGEEYLYNDINYSNYILESDSDSIVAELSKEDYEKIYRRVNIIERSNVVAFLVNLRIFNSSRFFLPKMQRCLIKRYYAKNEIIFRQNDKFRTFFIIRKGKVNLSISIQKKVNCSLEPEIIMGNQKNQRFTSNKAFVIKGNYLENNDYNIMAVQEGEFLGDIEYYKKIDHYVYTAQCEVDCILFEMDLFLFENLIKNNNSINMNLKGFFEKINEKIELYQERLYSMKTNNSVIKKSDYILSKNKFTKNLLQNHPIKEEKEKENIRRKYLQSGKYKKMNKSDYFYFGVISPFLKRNASARRDKKMNQIKINDEFFITRNKSKEDLLFSSQSTSRTRERNTTTPNKLNINPTILKSRIMMYNNLFNKNYMKINLSKINNSKNNNINLLADKYGFNIKKNLILKDYFNSNKKVDNPIKTNFLLDDNHTEENLIKIDENEPSKKTNDNIKINKSKIFMHKTSFDFLDSNLVFKGNEKIKNIPIILKETKKSKRYKEIYKLENINKIKTFYYNSPRNIKKINKIDTEA